MIAQFPHCESRILHAPGECEFCDACPDLQELRVAWNIAFTGHKTADVDQLPCPADHAVTMGARGDHRKWFGNVAAPQEASS